jgi:hypothetical protein
MDMGRSPTLARDGLRWAEFAAGMVNSGLRNPGAFGPKSPVRDRHPLKALFATKAALTNQAMDVLRHQKLFWPGRFMVY